ncbi:MAG: transglutaminase family protein [Emcibacter sp.]|nr:transglutaminase family protein [Emcibacter sp.]
MIEENTDDMAYLKAVGEGDGNLLDIAYTALLLASFDRPGVSFQKYEHHLKILALDLAGEALEAGSAVERAQALARVLHDRHEYTGNEEYYEDLQNANLMSVIDTRKGLPVTLSILYMHTARAQGWHVEGLAFPQHFLIRLSGAEAADGQVIIDPFNDGAILDARDLRKMIRELSHADAELKPDYYEAITDRDILVRLLNNIKIRCLKVSDLGQAINILSRLVMIDPEMIQHHYELGMLLAHVGKAELARESLNYCLDHSEQFEQNDLIEQQVINTLNSLDKQANENYTEKYRDNVLKLPETE